MLKAVSCRAISRWSGEFRAGVEAVFLSVSLIFSDEPEITPVGSWKKPYNALEEIRQGCRGRQGIVNNLQSHFPEYQLRVKCPRLPRSPSCAGAPYFSLRTLERAFFYDQRKKPIAEALILCDEIITEAGTNKKSLIGTFNSIVSAEFPMQHAKICVYAAMTNGQGEMAGVLRCVAVSMTRRRSSRRREQCSSPTRTRSSNFELQSPQRSPSKRPGLARSDPDHAGDRNCCFENDVFNVVLAQ